MKGLWFTWPVWSWVVVAVVAFFAGFFVMPLIFKPTVTTTTPTTTQPQLPPVQPTPAAQFVVDSVKFCQTTVGDVCTTHATSFTNPNRVYVTATYSNAQVGKVISFTWFNRTGVVEEKIAGDSEETVASSGSMTMGLGQTPEGEGMPLTVGTYVLRLMDESNTVLKSAEFVVV